MSRYTVAAAAAAVLGLTALGAAPASAAELPEGAELYALSFEAYWSMGTDGALAPVAELPDTGGKYGADVDPTTGIGYYFADANPCLLYSIDTATGASTLIGTVGGVTDFNECDALNVDADGVLRIADQDGIILTVDKATGAVISSVVSDVDSISFLAQAPDGTYYLGTYGGELFTYDPATGAGTLVDDEFGYFESGVIDDEGTLWYLSDGEECIGLYSVALTDLSAATFEGDAVSVEGCENTYALLVTRAAVDPVIPAAPQLAATGSTPAFVVAPLAALVLLAGAGALFLARRRAA